MTKTWLTIWQRLSFNMDIRLSGKLLAGGIVLASLLTTCSLPFCRIARADTPYLLTDSSTIPKEPQTTALLKSALYAAEKDSSGDLWLFKMGPSDTIFKKVVMISKETWSYSYIEAVGDYLLIKLTTTSNDIVHLISDGSSAPPKKIPIADNAKKRASMGNRIFFELENEEADLTQTLGFDIPSFTVENISEHHRWKTQQAWLGVIRGRYIIHYDNMYDETSSLWSTDGTKNGTYLIKKFDNYRYTFKMRLIDEHIFFGRGGSQLWKTDGTSAGTELVFDLAEINLPGLPPGKRFLFDGVLTKFKGSLVFLVKFVDGSLTELWQTGGAPGNTTPLTTFPKWDSYSNYYPYANIRASGDRLLIHDENPYGGTTLWGTDGTNAGTEILLESRGSLTMLDAPDRKRTFINLYKPSSSSLYITDGTTANTKLIRSFGEIGSLSSDWAELGVGQIGDSIVFPAQEEGSLEPRHLWRSNGEVDGTTPLISASHGSKIYNPGAVIEIDKTLIVRAQGGVIWSIDQNLVTAPRGFNVASGNLQTASSNLSLLAAHKGKFIFSGAAPGRGKSFLSSEFEQGGTFVSTETPNSLSKISSAIPISSAEGYEFNFHSYGGPKFTEVGNHLYFYSYGFDKSDQEYWTNATFYRTDLTEAGTVSLGSFGIGGEFGETTVGRFRDNFVFIGADSQSSGVFSVNGSEAGMKKVEVTNPRWRNQLPVLKDFFLYESYEDGEEIVWRSDGTPAGTQRTGLATFNFEDYQYLDGAMYFIDKESPGYDNPKFALWRTDGSKAGTQVVKTLTCDSIYHAAITEYRSNLLIICGNENLELWRSDGTPEGTSLLVSFKETDIREVRAINATPNYAYISLTGYDDMSFQLWRTDGTASGTMLVKAWDYGLASFRWRNFGSAVTLGSTLYITVWNHTKMSYDIWKSDGTPDGTVPALAVPADYFKNIGPRLIANEDKVGFMADDGVVGLEPWVLATKDVQDSCPEDFRKLSPGVCGCGKPEIDSDLDGITDCLTPGGDSFIPTPTPTLTPTPQPTYGGQTTPKVAGISVKAPTMLQRGRSTLINMQPMQGVTYKVSFSVQAPGAAKKKKKPQIKIITSHLPQVKLGNFKVGAVLSVSYKIVLGNQESLPSKLVRFKVKVPKK
jgi:ELWxxDGT repeat protein